MEHCPCEGMLGSADCAIRSSFLLFFLKGMFCFPPRALRNMGLCAFFSCLFLRALWGQVSSTAGTQVMPTLSPRCSPLQQDRRVFVCRELLNPCLLASTESCRQRAYPATSAVVPQVSLPHLHQRFSPFLPGQLCCSWNNSWSATVHSPNHDSKPLLAKVQRHSPHHKLSCPHFSIQALHGVLLLPGEWSQRVTMAKTSFLT